MKKYWGSDAQLHTFLTSALGIGECSALRPGRIKPVSNRLEAGWAPEPGQDAVARRKNGTPVVQPVT